jgi:hypothetical protein
MARLRESFLFGVNGLWVDDRVLGGGIDCERGGLQVELRLPTETDQYRGRFGSSAASAAAIGRVAHDESRERHVSQVHVVEVNVRGVADVSPADFVDMDPAGDAVNTCMGFWSEANGAAISAVAEFRDWVRTWGQPWLGLHGEMPQIVGRPMLYDEDLDVPVPVDWSWWPSGAWVIPDTVLCPEDLQSMGRRIAGNLYPSLPSTILADAQYLMSGPNGARAVLTAAIALEVKVKDVLRRAASPPADKVIEVLLNNPRDWSMAAASLFDKPMEAVTGRSLRKENKDLYKTTERLFTVRNGVAHRGEAPTPYEEIALVEGAVEVMAWLEGIQTSAEVDAAKAEG